MMRSTTAAVTTALLLAAASTTNALDRPQNSQGCDTASAWGCSASELRGASEESLRAAGASLSMSCKQRMEEPPVDAAYVETCVAEANRLTAFLSQKWDVALEPIDPGLVRYDWNKNFGCITFVTGACLCPIYGVAKIPLRWRNVVAIPANAS